MSGETGIMIERNPQEPPEEDPSSQSIREKKSSQPEPASPSSPTSRSSSQFDQRGASRHDSITSRDNSPVRDIRRKRSDASEIDSSAIARRDSSKSAGRMSDKWNKKILHTFNEWDSKQTETEAPRRGVSAIIGKAASKKCCGNQSKVVKKLEELEEKLLQEKTKNVPWIKTSQADALFGFAIVCGAITVGADLERDASAGKDAPFWANWTFESILLIIFLAEIFLRAKADGFQRYLQKPSGLFDVFVTVVGCIDTWALTFSTSKDSSLSAVGMLRVLRLARLMRLMRLFKIFKELVVLLTVLAQSLGSVLWLCLLFLAVIFTSSVLVVVLLKKQSRDENSEINMFFGNVFRAIFWHFTIATMENWTTIARVTRKESDWWLLYWIFLIVLLNFVMLNLTVGLMVTHIVRKTQELDRDTFNLLDDLKLMRSSLRKVLPSIGIEEDTNVLTCKELKMLCNSPQLLAVLDCFGVKTDVPPKFLWTNLHFEGVLEDNTDSYPNVDFEDFVEACANLRGASRDPRTLFVRYDISELHNSIEGRITRLESRLSPFLIEEELVHDEPGSASASATDKTKEDLQGIQHEMGALEDRQAQVLAKIGKLLAEPGACAKLPVEVGKETKQKSLKNLGSAFAPPA
eukprot:gnl/MRDRNA2_/MRDRNA2_124750_c0_seq1.p1 gnl/MRDRNA2_/MRDRNA2_124750_c0~~gnl/MRDRNA2_/MRDRNA2_124750_c0_seq1.p1  ORF type:complete len:633 (+),score=129.92 gnl/MRDRNA2_/MRDRNA2_124750_c0_seq1:229-2127(+)